MRIPRSVRHPIETLKTAPVGFTDIAISLSFLGLGATFLSEQILDEHNESSVIGEVGSIAGDAVLLSLGYYIGKVGLEKVGHSFDHRNRMEEVLQRTGFNERVMEQTLELYCDRQATLVACDRFNMRDEYLNLMKNADPEDMAGSCLPHF